MRIGIILLAGTALAACSGAQGPSGIRWSGNQAGQPVMGDEAYYYAQAKTQLAAGNAALAIDGFRKALRINPRSVDALNGLGAAYDRMGRFDLSGNYYEQALGFEPNSRMTLNNYGYSLALQGKADQAKLLLARASVGGEASITAMAARNLAQVSITMAAPAPGSPEPVAKPRSWVQRLTASTQLLVTRLLHPGAAQSLAIVDREAMPADGDRPAHFSPQYHRQRLPLNSGLLSQITSDEVVSGAGNEVAMLVLNGVGRRGMAGRMAAFLAEEGYVRPGIGDAGRMFAETEIIYPRGQDDAAARVAARLPFRARLKSSTSAHLITVKLGSDAVHFDEHLHSLSRRA